MAQDKDQKRVLVKTITNAGNFLIRGGSFSFSRTTFLHGGGWLVGWLGKLVGGQVLLDSSGSVRFR